MRTERQQYEREQQAIVDDERRYAESFDEDDSEVGIYGGSRCADCGEPGLTTGHMGCQYPQDH